MTIVDSSSAGAKWLENVSGKQNTRNKTLIVAVTLLILAASLALIITIIVYRRFRTKRYDEEALWAASEKRRSSSSTLALDKKSLEQDLNPNWVPFRPPQLSSIPKVHLRSPSPPTRRPFLRPLHLGKPSATLDNAHPQPAVSTSDAEMTPTPTQTVVQSSQDTPPAIARSPPRLTVKVPPPPSMTTVIATPSPRSVKFLPGPSSSVCKTEVRGRWTRATQVLRSPVVRSKGNNTPVTASFLEGGKKKFKTQAARRAEAEKEFWSASTSPLPPPTATVSPAAQKLNQLIMDMEREYRELGKM